MARTILHYGTEYLGTPAQLGVIPEGVLIADLDTNTIKMGNGVDAGGVSVTVQADVAFSDITGKPTTLAGYGITDAVDLTGSTFTGDIGIERNTTGTFEFENTTVPADDTIQANGKIRFSGYNPEGGAGHWYSEIRGYQQTANGATEDGAGSIDFAVYTNNYTVSPQLMQMVNINEDGVDIVRGGLTFSAGTTADFTNATVTGLNTGQNIIKAYAHVDVSAPITASASFNVASVTSSATGKYDVTFTNALPNANYVVSLSVQTNVTSNHYTVCYYNRSTTGFQVQKFLDGVLDSGASGNFSFVIYQA